MPFPMWTVPREWSGETAVILGGGPSLTPEQVTLAKAYRRIACNNSFMLDPTVDVVCWNDDRWWHWNKERLQAFRGRYMVTWGQSPLYIKAGIKQLQHLYRDAFTLDPAKISGQNAGHGAINLAYHFGVKRILLLGFDMTSTRGHNWHSYHIRHAKERMYTETFIPQLEKAAPILVEHGVEVINCTPESALQCFPFGRIEDIVAAEFPVEQLA